MITRIIELIRIGAALGFAALCLSPGAVSAQGLALGGLASGPTTVPPATLSLTDSIALAAKASSALAIANRTLDRDAARVTAAKDTGGPRASASASATHYDAQTVLGFLGYNIVVQPQDVQVYGFNASLPIDLSGQIRAQVDVAKLQALSDKFARDTISNNLVLNVQAYYFQVLRAQHQVQVAQASLANAQAQQQIASQQYQAGTGQRIDLLRANTQVASAQQALTQSRNALSLATVNFNDVVGRPLDAQTSVLDVPGVTTGISARPAAAPGAPTDTLAYFATPLDQVNSIDVAASIAEAVNARPELREDLTSIQAAKRSIKLARAELEPSLTLNAAGNYFHPQSFQTPRSTVREVNVMLNIPIFDSGVTRERVREAGDNVEIARTTYEAHKTDVASQVRQAYLNLQNTAQQIDSANIALQQAAAARQLAQTRFEGGVGLYLEVTDAEAALTAAETSQVNAVYDYLVAHAQFENAVGTPNLTPTLPTTLSVQPAALPATPPELPAAPALGTPAVPAPTLSVPAPAAPGASAPKPRKGTGLMIGPRPAPNASAPSSSRWAAPLATASAAAYPTN